MPRPERSYLPRSYLFFGTYRRDLLDSTVRDLAAQREQHLAALRREIDDTTRMIKTLVRDFSRNDTPSEDFVRDINTERAELHHRKIELEAQLAEAEEANQRAPNPDRSTLCP